MAQLSAIEGIGEKFSLKLTSAGIRSLENLLQTCSKKKERKKLAQETGISEKLILNWVNRADLARIKGVGTQYADLLEVAGVDTVPELAQRNPENLHAKMLEINDQKKLVRKTPTVKQVQDWVTQAKVLPRIITH